MYAGVGKGKPAELFDETVAICEYALGIGCADQVAEPADDLASAESLRRNLLKRIPDLGSVGVPPGQQPVARLGIARDGGEWLVQLVGNAGGHLAHGGEARDVAEPL